MTEIKVALTDIQNKCLESITVSVQKWCDNAVHNRAKVAQDEIISSLVKHCNENNIAIATGEDAQVTQAYDLKVVMTASEKQAELDKNIHKG